MTFTLRRIYAQGLQDAPAYDGVIKASSLAALEDAHDVITRARAEADRLLDEARALANAELQRKREELDAGLWQQAAQYAQALQTEWARAIASLEDRMVAQLGRAVCRLVAEVPPETRLRACVRQLLDESGSPDTGQLLASRTLQPAALALEGNLPWPVEFSDELPEGTVRLQTAQGRWEWAFASAVEHLSQTLAKPRPGETQETQD